MTEPSVVRGLRVRMISRSATEPHRASSPLELLFDLTFVVAVAQLVVQLAHSIEEGHISTAIGPYLMVFFAIWWAWMNFTWFASTYDTDDVPYRILTMLQMAGVLVLAAGVPAAFLDGNLTAVTIGYLVMRLALVAQWLRAAAEDSGGRRTALRYALGVSLVQVGWLLRLLLPPDAAVWSFLVLMLLEVSVPVWAARSGEPVFHPHHIAERYGLFTIIVLGESVLAATVGVQAMLASGGLSWELVFGASGALVLLFSLWWLYFAEPAGEGLAEKPRWSYYWGYGHFFVFASLAAIGAGLEVTMKSVGHEHESSPTIIALAVAVPVTIYLLLLWLLHAPLVGRAITHPVATVVAAIGVLGAPFLAPTVGAAVAVVIIAVVVAGLLAVTLGEQSARARLAREAQAES